MSDELRRIVPAASSASEMDERENHEDTLSCQIEQLQRERDELKKDIEQLCLQQAGPGYLAVATRMHFQRTAALEQEIESLKKKLAGCTRENQNLQEELSEAYRIKGQLADLHSAEVLKNKEAEKQVKFFQSSVAAAFAERDHAVMESEKSKEQEEAMSRKLLDAETRLEELQSAHIEEKELSSALKMELKGIKEQNEYFEEVVNKFFEIRERDVGFLACNTWQDKCTCLLDDPSDNWVCSSDNETSTSKYIASLEEEIESLRNSMDKLQNNFRMGLDIEQHLKRKVKSLEKKQIHLDEALRNELAALRSFYMQWRVEVMRILDGETAQLRSMLLELHNKTGQYHMENLLKFEALQREKDCDDTECRDVHITNDTNSSFLAKVDNLSTAGSDKDRTLDASDALAQALQEKVAALLLLSQQEERHLLERDVNIALQKKIEELQKNLFQVTNEKVKALMELAQLKREHQLLQESTSHGVKHGTVSANASERSITSYEREGRLKNLLKRTSLRHWIGKGHTEIEVDSHVKTDESNTDWRNDYFMDIARLRVENAALQESMTNIEHLTSSTHKLRILLLKAKDDGISAGPVDNIIETLDGVIMEANNMKTALGGSLPISWSTDAAVAGTIYESLCEPTDPKEASKSEKVDPVSWVGFEMRELLILAAQLQKERMMESSSTSQI